MKVPVGRVLRLKGVLSKFRLDCLLRIRHLKVVPTGCWQTDVGSSVLNSGQVIGLPGNLAVLV